jgi:hypothetical protein
LPEPFELTLSADELGMLCERFDLSPLVALERSATPSEGVDAVLARVGGRGEDVRRALTVLSSPETVVRMQRRDATGLATASIGIAGGVAAEHRPLQEGRHLVGLLASDEALERTLAFCRLGERPVHQLPAFTVTPAQLLHAVDLAGRGEVRLARAALGAPGPADPSRGTFARALASGPVAAHVTVLTHRGDGRLEGTTTSWLDGGEAGLWRIPPVDVTAPAEPDGLDQGALYQTVLEVAPTSREAIIDEITEGFPELRRT